MKNKYMRGIGKMGKCMAKAKLYSKTSIKFKGSGKKDC